MPATAGNPDEPGAGRSVHDVLTSLGPRILQPLTSFDTAALPAHEVTIHDRGEPLDVADIVLAVGIHTDDAASGPISLLPTLQRHGAVALVVKGPADTATVAAFEHAGIALLRAPADISWARLLQLVKSAVTTTPGIGRITGGDLFTVANAVSALLDAPVTIEDRHSCVLAYSDRQHEADSARADTILARRVPEDHLRALHAAGVFTHLASRDEPLYWDGSDHGVMPRLVVAVRAGGELLGTLWAVMPQPPTRQQMRAFEHSAHLVALHLLQQRSTSDDTEAQQASLATHVLTGHRRSTESLGRLGLQATPVHVIALTLRHENGVELLAWQERVRDSLRLHLMALDPRSVCVRLGQRIYAIVPATRKGDSVHRAKQVVTDFLQRTRLSTHADAAVSERVGTSGDIHDARLLTDELLDVAAAHGSHGVTDLEQMRLRLLLQRLVDATPERDLLRGPQLRAMLDYDQEHGGAYVQTLGAYLDAFGDVAVAAEALHVHKNSLRYRIRRLQEMFDLDLDDADTRLSVHIQLRLLDRHALTTRAAPA